MYTMRYTPLHSLLFSTLLACQTKHHAPLDGLEETEDVQEKIDSEESKPTEQVRLPDAHEGMKSSPTPKKEVLVELAEYSAANATVEDVVRMQEILSVVEDAPTHSQVPSSLSGVIGAKGIQAGSGGLGASGGGLGGSGNSVGVAALGTKGSGRSTRGSVLGKGRISDSKDTEVSSLSKSAKAKRFEGKVSCKPGII